MWINRLVRYEGSFLLVHFQAEEFGIDILDLLALLLLALFDLFMSLTDQVFLLFSVIWHEKPFPLLGLLQSFPSISFLLAAFPFFHLLLVLLKLFLYFVVLSLATCLIAFGH